MTELKPPTKPVPDWEKVRDEWVGAVEQLVGDVGGWCQAKDWPTRRIGKRLAESGIGECVVPALMIQVDLVKLLLEPVAQFTADSESPVDLYRMPQYDDVATIYRRNGVWLVDKFVGGDDVPSPSGTVTRRFRSPSCSVRSRHNSSPTPSN